MRKRSLALMFAAATCFVFVSCKKEKDINIDHLIGSWSIYNDDPLVVMEGSVHYTFQADKNCQISIYNALSNHDTTLYRTYIISNDHKLLTIYDGQYYSEQYNIIKLNHREMQWTNASPHDGNTDKKLIKIDDNLY
jgi:hypothetical protein